MHLHQPPHPNKNNNFEERKKQTPLHAVIPTEIKFFLSNKKNIYAAEGSPSKRPKPIPPPIPNPTTNKNSKNPTPATNAPPPTTPSHQNNHFEERKKQTPLHAVIPTEIKFFLSNKKNIYAAEGSPSKRPKPIPPPFPNSTTKKILHRQQMHHHQPPHPNKNNNFEERKNKPLFTPSSRPK